MVVEIITELGMWSILMLGCIVQIYLTITYTQKVECSTMSFIYTKFRNYFMHLLLVLLYLSSLLFGWVVYGTRNRTVLHIATSLLNSHRTFSCLFYSLFFVILNPGEKIPWTVALHYACCNIPYFLEYSPGFQLNPVSNWTRINLPFQIENIKSF